MVQIMPTTGWLTTLSIILILWFGGQMVMDGTLTIGAIVAFNAYILIWTRRYGTRQRGGRPRRVPRL
jgi:ABC-type bacteriocin/lantibiotic exporter with double-glycine peptidase domain